MEETIKIEEIKKPYTFRRLDAPDTFVMFKIISTIGIDQFTACFEKDGIQKLATSLMGDDNEEAASILGITVMLDVANVIMGNLPKCENEIYQILSQTSNLSVKEVKALDMVTFFEMVIDFVKKEEFKDFIKVVSRLFK